MRRVARCVSSAARTAFMAGQEVAWLGARVVLYPGGVWNRRHSLHDGRYRLDDLSPVQRALIVSDTQGHGVPIVLIHGIVDNRSAFSRLIPSLRRRGHTRISTMNYSMVTTDVRKTAARLGAHVEAVCEQTGYEKVHVVGHSLGGVIARYYVQRLGGDRRVSTVVTVGSPHQGTRLASWFPLLVARQLRPTAELIRELAAPTACSTRFVAIWSDRDEIIVPNRSAELTHPDLDVTSVRISGVGHIALLADTTTVRAIVDGLSTVWSHAGRRISA